MRQYICDVCKKQFNEGIQNGRWEQLLCEGDDQHYGSWLDISITATPSSSGTFSFKNKPLKILDLCQECLGDFIKEELTLTL